MIARSLIWALLAVTAFLPVSARGQELPVVPFASPEDATGPGRIDAIFRTKSPRLLPMTPLDKSGLTASTQPTLYWYSPVSLDRDAIFRLHRDGGGLKPLLVFECRIPASIASGVHAIQLADHGLSLEENSLYVWHVTVPDTPTQNATLSSHLQVPGGQRLDRLRQELATTADPFAVYVRQGYWYDALASIVRLLDFAPRSTGYRNRYERLLRDVSLNEVAGSPTSLPPSRDSCEPATR
jgi:hypothetical protein